VTAWRGAVTAWRAAAIAASVAVGAVAWCATDPPGSATAHESFRICLAARSRPEKEQRAEYDRGLALADKAIAANERDAIAHFAAFCNLGRRMQRDGIAWDTLGSYRRLRREVDRAVELAPTYVDALVGKGSLLRETPRVLGGDPVEGERLIRAALAIDPDFAQAHIELARSLAARHARDEARAELKGVLEREPPDSGDAAEARKLLAELGG